MNILKPGDTPDDLQCAFGKIPESVVDMEQTRVIAWHNDIAELVSGEFFSVLLGFSFFF